MTEYVREWEDVYRALVNEVLRGIEFALQPFANSLDAYLAELFSARLPSDWRERWHAFVTEQAELGFLVEPESVEELEAWIEQWAGFCGLLPTGAENAGQNLRSHESGQLELTPTDTTPHVITPLTVEFGNTATSIRAPAGSPPIVHPTGRGDQSGFGREAEEIVARRTGVELNVSGPEQHRIPGTGRGGYRIPDFKIWGPAGSLYQRGSIIEVKASRGNKFGDLSSLSRQQIRDGVTFVRELRASAKSISDSKLKSILTQAHVEVFTDLPMPELGEFSDLITENVLKWRKIPRPQWPKSKMAPPQSIGRPGIGTAKNIALGIIISIVEADVANSFYRKSAAALAKLLEQIESREEASELEWDRIGARLSEISRMKQSLLGHAWELVTYGQGSLAEKKGIALLELGNQLADRFGYEYTADWGTLLRGDVGQFKKRQ
jgi:hypothetical protein